MIPYSLLDLVPVPEGHTAAEALANTGDLARHAETWGYHRYWLAEHHNTPGIASSATAVLIGHVAGLTARIRVGAGGIMLPNHAPLVVAEQFGTLATLYPGRIDLGLGRAPGTDAATMAALRRDMTPGNRFAADVQELISYLGTPHRRDRVQALPGAGTKVPVFILGSSLKGAELAAALGLPYAFASHFAPPALEPAFDLYRRAFRPSEHLAKPHAMMAINVFAAATDAEGARLKTSMMLALARRRGGLPGKLPRPVADIADILPPAVLSSVDEAMSCTAAGAPDTVRTRLRALIGRFAPDEVILHGSIHDHAARLVSFRIAAGIMQSLPG